MVGELFVEDVRYIEVQVLNREGEVCGEVCPALHQRGLKIGEALNHVVTNLYQHIQKAVCIAGVAARRRGRCGVCARVRCRRRRGSLGHVGNIIVVVGYTIVGVVFFGFVVVDDGIFRNVRDRFVVFVDSGVLGVDVR